MNAIELLKKDHRTVKSLFESFEKAKEKEEETSKADLFASIKEELDAHARVEEEIFYPAFDQAAEKEDDKELVLEAGEEHKQVKTLLAELQGLDPDDETFDAKMKVLKDNIEHHVKEEEGEMFPHAEKQLTGDELEQLGQRIAARKEEIQQQAGRPAARSASQSASSPSSRARAASPGRRSGRGSSSKNGKAGVAPASPGKRRSSSTGRSTGARRSSGGRASGRSTSGRSTSGRGRSSSGRGPSSSTGGRSASSRRGATSSRRGPASGRGGRSRGRGRSARSKQPGEPGTRTAAAARRRRARSARLSWPRARPQRGTRCRHVSARPRHRSCISATCESPGRRSVPRGRGDDAGAGSTGRVTVEGRACGICHVDKQSRRFNKRIPKRSRPRARAVR